MNRSGADWVAHGLAVRLKREICHSRRRPPINLASSSLILTRLQIFVFRSCRSTMMKSSFP